MADNTTNAAGSLVARMAGRFGVDANKLLHTLKSTAFKQGANDPEVSNEQMMALLVVADQYGLNPFTKEIYAFPDKKGGIVPVVGVDGWSRIINSHPAFDGMEFNQSGDVALPDRGQESPEWIECIIYRKDRSHAVTIREYLDECYRPAFVKGDYIKDGPWQSHTKRMLRHKAMIQGARIAFGFVGIYDEDEAGRIIEGVAATVQEPAAGVAAINAKVAPKRIEHVPVETIPAVVAQENPEPIAAEPIAAESTPAPIEAPLDILGELNHASTLDQLWAAADLIRSMPDGAEKDACRARLAERQQEMKGAE